MNHLNSNDLDPIEMTGMVRPGAPETAHTGYLPALVDAGLQRCRRQRELADALPHRANVDNAVRAERLAVLAEREARWWAVLARWAYSRAGRSVPWVFADAAHHAGARARDDGRFWREAAADWRARAEHRPTSDAAGALCNHHELGMAS